MKVFRLQATQTMSMYNVYTICMKKKKKDVGDDDIDGDGDDETSTNRES